MDKNKKLKLIVILFIILMVILIVLKISTDKKEKKSYSAKLAVIFENVTLDTKANISKFYTYGTHLNIEGTIDIPKISKISISNVAIIMKNLDNLETSINSYYTYKDNILSFSSSSNMNEGINLDSLENGNFYVFIKVFFSNNEEKIYSLNNKSTYGNITYYTMTKNCENNIINISFDSYNDLSFLKVDSTKVNSLPESIYDIVIDPGHGGTDNGAKSNGKNEADIVLDCAKILEQNLESAGYKVLLTRTTNETPSDPYSEKGRVNIANKSNAKLLISLHMNNMSSMFSKGGIEIYAPSNCNLNFAKFMANNIVTKAKTTYSTLKLHKKDDRCLCSQLFNY